MFCDIIRIYFLKREKMKKFLKVLNRYLLVQMKMINLKGIVLVSSIIPFIVMSMTLTFQSPFNNKSGIDKYRMAEQSGFFDWVNSTWSFFGGIVKSIFGFNESLSILIFSSLLFGITVWLLMTHLFYLFFELIVYINWRLNKKENFESKDEAVKYVYFHIFKENM